MSTDRDLCLIGDCYEEATVCRAHYDALAARLADAESEITRFNAESRRRRARLAEAEALLRECDNSMSDTNLRRAVRAFLASKDQPTDTRYSAYDARTGHPEADQWSPEFMAKHAGAEPMELPKIPAANELPEMHWSAAHRDEDGRHWCKLCGRQVAVRDQPSDGS